MTIPISGARVLLTGASGGIGDAIARELHGRGATVVVSGRRAELLDALREELGPRIECAPADLAKAKEVDGLVAAAGAVDVLVANAGLPASGPYDGFTVDEIDRALMVNLRAPIQLTRALAPAMVGRGKGQLVYISSISGKIATSGASLYSATKFGLRGYAFGVGRDLTGSGVGASCVFPGFISDAGMFADTGLETPPGIGTSKPEEVVAAVVKAIERGPSEIDVAPAFVRASAKLSGIAPNLVAGISTRLGGEKFAGEFGKRQQDKQ
ncbi:MAG: SDR family NAD(P)-dependent oxidoreductase [Thermoleophilaceae bacterium]|nr:SDR family NAD(P)-dependent oxidoreductase [Thermoleophilaceae bacterium]